MSDVLLSLNETRENLLREYCISRGADRAKVLVHILDIEEEIHAEGERRNLTPPILPAGEESGKIVL